MTSAVRLDDLITLVKTRHPDGDALERLGDAVAVGEHLGEVADHLIGHFVDQARRAGASWTDIGKHMGVTKQAVQKRFVPRAEGADARDFARFTDKARRAVVAAQAAARRTRQEQIAPEHLVLGLLTEPTALAATTLTALGVDLDVLRDRVEAGLGRVGRRARRADPLQRTGEEGARAGVPRGAAAGPQLRRHRAPAARVARRRGEPGRAAGRGVTHAAAEEHIVQAVAALLAAREAAGPCTAASPTFRATDPANVSRAPRAGRRTPRRARGRGRARAGPRPGRRRPGRRSGWARRGGRGARGRSRAGRRGRTRCGPAPGRSRRPPGSRAGTMPSSSGVPASHTCAERVEGGGSRRCARRPPAGSASTPMRGRADRTEQRPAAAGRRSSARPPARPSRGDERPQHVRGRRPRHRADRAVAGRGGQPAGQHARAATARRAAAARGPRSRAGHLGHVRAQPLGEAGGELAHGAAVGEHPVAGVQLDRRRRASTGPAACTFTHGGRAGSQRLVEGVEVGAQQVDGPAVVAARLRGDPVAGRPAPRRRCRRAGPRCGRSCPRRPRGRAARAGAGARAARPTTTAAASRGSVPGIEPTPVAAPSGQRAGGAGALVVRSGFGRRGGGRSLSRLHAGQPGCGQGGGERVVGGHRVLTARPRGGGWRASCPVSTTGPPRRAARAAVARRLALESRDSPSSEWRLAARKRRLALVLTAQPVGGDRGAADDAVASRRAPPPGRGRRRAAARRARRARGRRRARRGPARGRRARAPAPTHVERAGRRRRRRSTPGCPAVDRAHVERRRPGRPAPCRSPARCPARSAGRPSGGRARRARGPCAGRR